MIAQRCHVAQCPLPARALAEVWAVCQSLHLRALGYVLSLLLAACTGPGVQRPVAAHAPARVGDGLPNSALVDRAQQCSTAPKPRPLRLLNTLEYANTLRDLFPGEKLPAPAQLSDSSNATQQLGLSPLLLERQLDTAVALAKLAAPRMQQLGQCPAVEANGCTERWIKEFGLRSFRRPLTRAELASLAEVHRAALERVGPARALQQTVAAILVAPPSIYRLDLVGPSAGGDPASNTGDPNPREADDYAIASRLSYFLWQTMPDEALFTAAANGELSTDAGVAAQVRRMLNDPKASRAFAAFVADWFELERINTEPKSPLLFSHWRPESQKSALEESLRFAEWTFTSSQPTLATLLLSSHAELDDAMSAAYGVPPTGAWHTVQLDPAQRAGLLTRIAFLAGRGHAVASPPLRGNFVLKRLLCDPPPSPPANVAALVPRPNSTEKVSTNRQRFQSTISAGGHCNACHASIDRFGYAFENYDGAGSYQQTEQGLPIDAAVDLSKWGWGNVVTGGVELSQRLAESQEVAYCAIASVYEYGLRREVGKNDWCRVDPLYHEFAASGGNLRTALASIATSREFRN